MFDNWRLNKLLNLNMSHYFFPYFIPLQNNTKLSGDLSYIFFWLVIPVLTLFSANWSRFSNKKHFSRMALLVAQRLADLAIQVL